MHEMSLAEGMLQLIEDAARAQSFTKVSVVRLEIGQLSGVEPEAMRFCFDAVTRDGVAQGAQLEIIELPGTGWRPYAAAFHLGAALRAQLAYRTAPGGNRLTNWIVNGRDLVSTWRVRMTMRPWLDRALAFLHEAERRGWPSGTDLDDPAFDLLRPRAEFAAVRARHP